MKERDETAEGAEGKNAGKGGREDRLETAGWKKAKITCVFSARSAV
jgi:hypothetical protein